MTVTKLWRYSLIGIWALYIISLFRVGAAFVATQDPGAAALAAFWVFVETFMVPVGVLTLVLLIVQKRLDPIERRAYRDDERKASIWSRSARTGFWILLFGNVAGLASAVHIDWHLPVIVLSTILSFGVIFCMAAADEFQLMSLEDKAD